ncbi:MAG: endonuclease/exonuclease/phosphatase family protein [Pseudomonadota bacterium]
MKQGTWAWVASVATCLGALAILGGFVGSYHAAGDSLAVFRVPIAIGTLVGAIAALVTGARLIGMGGLCAGILALATVFPHWVSFTGRVQASEAVIAVYQKNLWFRLPDPAEIVADIRGSGADIVTLQEVGPRTEPVLAALRDIYPVQRICPSFRVGGAAVLSRLPEVPGSGGCKEGLGLATVALETPDGPILAASVHLHWPWPHSQAEQIEVLSNVMQEWDSPAIIGGDFNMVRWSHALRTIGRASRTAPIGPARVTLRNKRFLLNLSIDHVLASGGRGTTVLRPRAGSDHHGLLARIAVQHNYATRP